VPARYWRSAVAQNVEALRRAYEASSQSNPEPFMDICAPDIVFDLSRSPFPEAGVYHGHDGLRAWFRGLGSAFQNLRYEAEDITDLGFRQVLTVIRVLGEGQFSEIGVNYCFATVSTFRDGKIVRQDRCNDRGAALEAVRLPKYARAPQCQADVGAASPAASTSLSMTLRRISGIGLTTIVVTFTGFVVAKQPGPTATALAGAYIALGLLPGPIGRALGLPPWRPDEAYITLLGRWYRVRRS
jgi:ketosteroid isomerase-like protein